MYYILYIYIAYTIFSSEKSGCNGFIIISARGKSKKHGRAHIPEQDDELSRFRPTHLYVRRINKFKFNLFSIYFYKSSELESPEFLLSVIHYFVFYIIVKFIFDIHDIPSPCT